DFDPGQWDLKPFVSDFGLAKRLGSEGLTITGMVMGTPGYMAPEQAAGGKGVGPAADIYAIGVILFECLTGRLPYRAQDSAELLLKTLNEDPPSIRSFVPGIPADLDRICMKCLAKAPAERYASAAALADDLHRFRNGEPVSVRPAGLLERTVMWCRRHPAR